MPRTIPNILFRVVTYKNIDKTNFLTMSSKGVLQHVGGEMIFTPLDKWESEYNMFCRLMRIKSFLHFRIWKAFYVWKKGLNFKKFSHAQKFLCENLFILIPDLCMGLLKIQSVCLVMMETTFTHVPVIDNFLLFYFIEVQVRQLRYAHYYHGGGDWYFMILSPLWGRNTQEEIIRDPRSVETECPLFFPKITLGADTQLALSRTDSNNTS